MNNLLRAAAVSVVAAASLFAAPAAFAAPNDNTCDFGEACVFLHFNYLGGMDDVASSDARWSNNYYSTGASLHDTASSGFGMERAEMFWVQPNFTGISFILGVNQYDPAWSTNQPNSVNPAYDFNDKIDSNAIFIP